MEEKVGLNFLSKKIDFFLWIFGSNKNWSIFASAFKAEAPQIRG